MKQLTGPLTCAAYLRCYPRDDWAMMGLQSALERHALVLGLPTPAAYIDNGCPSGEPAPGRTQLDRAVAAGWVSVVLVPGPWVFALNDADACRAVEEFTKQGCEVIELPRVQLAAPRGSTVYTWDRHSFRPLTCPPTRSGSLSSLRTGHESVPSR
ncbi:hypothetical protein AB0M29_38650 [Streptomyces sp. NPDC051976]|uniref:hypothetical protein n=1 Tax=Streptomyces sp. NPDC051976 TaxID=3154947 RepID=UPI0034250BBE